MTTQDGIDRFCEYFSGQIEAIRNLHIKRDENRDPAQYQIRFYRKVLLINAVDTLASIRFSKDRYPQLHKRNRERFIRFIQDGKCWTPGEYVSIPFLSERQTRGEIGPGRLCDLIDEKLAKIDPDAGGSIEFSEIDEPLGALIKLASSELEAKALRDCQHYNLLYRYRNYLVHGSREPGTSMEISPERTVPYYHGYVYESKLFLAYPEFMFMKLLENAINYIRQYLLSNSLNPYDFVEETSRW
ncbi:hypothetical protein [Cupriavidus sp. D39]|uniref:hypothetical protein n=1 Tax=Cupriavidus sp. D39 TaxID=2997877 RepID=UPI00226F7A57|nr:hypothetical protein [Cupriavidus sp. D39]MCY0852511.1 hypothetical protein [Cupriavidus sp. D39]